MQVNPVKMFKFNIFEQKKPPNSNLECKSITSTEKLGKVKSILVDLFYIYIYKLGYKDDYHCSYPTKITDLILIIEPNYCTFAPHL